ncbi:MAG TPA: DedA family protein [Clostridiales bacterium]|nr:DedA family protein [Clostridiales bacterium]
MNFLTDLIYKYGTLAMFLIIMLEYACFPVSSEIVLPFSGAVASINDTNFIFILVLSIIAGLIGTGITYTIGWFGGAALLNKIIKRFPKSEKGIDSAFRKFNNHGAAAVCMGRVIPLIRTYIALVAGSAKLSPVTYFSYSALGITIWNTLLIGLGYTLRENYETVSQYYSRYKHNLIPVFLISIAGIVINKIYTKRKKLKAANLSKTS